MPVLARPLSAFPPLPELRRLCRAVTRAVPEVVLSGHRVIVHDIRPNFIRAGRPVLEHVHSFYEGHILLEGSGLYAYEQPQRLGAGGSLLHGPHSAHAWEVSDVPCLRLLACFSIEPAVAVPRPAGWPEWPDILWDVAQLLDEAAVRQPGWHDRATARLSVILSRLLSIAHWPDAPQPAAMPQVQLIPMVDQFLFDNLTRPITLEDVAAHVDVSQRTLCRQFYALTGTTVIERLFNMRMDRAAALLAETDAPLAQIGLQVGMPDPSYFCRRFRKHFHVTPQTYRRAIVAPQSSNGMERTSHGTA